MTSAYTLSEAARLAGATVHQVRTYVVAPEKPLHPA